MDQSSVGTKKGESASSLARTHGVSVWSVITRLRQAGVVIRTPKEQNLRVLDMPRTCKFTYQEIVDGILLGDRQIDRKGNSSQG